MRTFLALCLLALCLPASADQRLFYQPLNRDANVTPAQWQQLWHATVAQGGKTLIVQWSAYGDSDFGGAQGWLADSLRSARAQGLQLVLGLYMDPAYYQRLDELDGEGLNSYWKAQLGRSLSQYQQLRQTWQLPVDGWYLPMELDDHHFREAERRGVGIVGELPGQLGLIDADPSEREREVAKLQGRGKRDDQEPSDEDSDGDAQA